jgi:hypothetical protein
MRQKPIKEIRKVIREKYPDLDPAARERLFKQMKAAYLATPWNKKHKTIVIE